jgi:ABC-type enterochelin transport system permease subunit
MIKNITRILGVLVAVASLSIADSAPDMKNMAENNFVETAQEGVKLSL